MPEYEESRRGEAACCGGHAHGEGGHSHGCGHGHAHSHSCGCASHDHAGHRAGCACCHPEEQEHGEENSPREIILAAAGGVLLAAGILLPWETAGWCVMIAAYLLVGFDIIRQAAENIRHGEVFDENFLMAVASIGAIAIGETPEAVLVMLLYRVGEYLQGRAVASSRRSIRALMDIRPDHANLLENGQVQEVEAERVRVGQRLLVKPGDRVPLDGVVEAGTTQLDTSALTGESMPRDCGVGDELLAGCINLSGAVTMRVSKTFGESAASRILELVEHAAKNKAVSERFISRFAKIYTPIVCALAVILAVVPPLAGWNGWSASLYNALCFLVISCPCALVISVPLSFFAGVGAASRAGVLVKGGNFLDALAKTETAAFDKTGTLTKGSFQVAEALPAEGIEKEKLIRWAAAAESPSNHPIGKAITAAWTGPLPPVKEFSEQAGTGVRALVEGHMVEVGKGAWFAGKGMSLPPVSGVGSRAYVCVDGNYAGVLVLRDVLKEDAKEAVEALRKLGVERLYMLTGDNKETADQIAGELNLDGAYSQLMPEDKLRQVEQLKAQASGRLLYAGDGINDTPVLASADIGVAMGGLGADAAIETADVVIMGDEPSKIAAGIRIARKTVAIANENIVFSLAVKIGIMGLAAAGLVELWLGVFADLGVCMLTILNALRINRAK